MINLRILIATLTIATAIAVTFVYREDPAYVWDYANYHDKYIIFGSIFGSFDWFYWMGVDIYAGEYNGSLLVPLMPFHALFGDGRTAYIIAIVLCYVVPTSLVLASVSNEVTLPDAANHTKLLVVLAAFLYTPLWASALRGMPDVGAMIPLVLATKVVWRSHFFSKRPVVNGILAGLLLWSAFLFRRWLAFSVMGLLLTTALLVAARLAHKRDAGQAWNSLIGGTLCALVIAAAVALFQYQFADRILSTPYSNLYESYRTNLTEQISVVARRVSPAILTLIVIGIALSVYRRITFPLFCLATAAVTFALFSRVQDMGFQHSMPVFVWLFPAYALAISTLVARAPKVAPVAIAAIAAAGFLGTLAPPVRSSLPSVMYAAEPNLPLRLGNFDEYKRLISDLERLTDGGKTVSIFAASLVLSQDLVASLSPSLKSRYIPVSVIDSLHKFKTEPLLANYVVVTTPAEIHLKPGAMQAIEVPNNQILRGSGIGAAYERASGPYNLETNHSAYVYQRVRPVAAEEIRELFDVFRITYPDWSSPLEIGGAPTKASGS